MENRNVNRNVIRNPICKKILACLVCALLSILILVFAYHIGFRKNYLTSYVMNTFNERKSNYSDIMELESELEKNSSEISNLTNDINELSAQIANADEFNANRDAYDDEINDLKKQLDGLMSEKTKKENSLTDINNALDYNHIVR